MCAGSNNIYICKVLSEDRKIYGQIYSKGKIVLCDKV